MGTKEENKGTKPEQRGHEPGVTKGHQPGSAQGVNIKPPQGGTGVVGSSNGKGVKK